MDFTLDEIIQMTEATRSRLGFLRGAHNRRMGRANAPPTTEILAAQSALEKLRTLREEIINGR